MSTCPKLRRKERAGFWSQKQGKRKERNSRRQQKWIVKDRSAYFRPTFDKTLVGQIWLYMQFHLWQYSLRSILQLKISSSLYNDYSLKLNIPFLNPAQNVVSWVNLEKKSAWLLMQTSCATTGIFTIFNFSAVLLSSSRPQPTTCCSENKQIVTERFITEYHYMFLSQIYVVLVWFLHSLKSQILHPSQELVSYSVKKNV